MKKLPGFVCALYRQCYANGGQRKCLYSRKVALVICVLRAPLCHHSKRGENCVFSPKWCCRTVGLFGAGSPDKESCGNVSCFASMFFERLLFRIECIRQKSFFPSRYFLLRLFDTLKNDASCRLSNNPLDRRGCKQLSTQVESFIVTCKSRLNIGLVYTSPWVISRQPRRCRFRPPLRSLCAL